MEQAFDRVVGKIYDAALDPQGWPALLEDIVNTIGAAAGFYAGLDTRRGKGAYWHALHHDAQVQALYNEYFLPDDPTLAHVIQSPGRVFSCVDYISDDVVATHPFYTQFLLPNGIRYVLSAVVSMHGSMVSFFGFQRAIGQTPFGPTETLFMQRLVPHFQKADELATRVSKIGESRRIAMAFLNRLTYGVVFVDQRGRIRLTNRPAETWLASGDVVSARFGRLLMHRSSEDQTLGNLIESASTATAAGEAQGGSFDSTDSAGQVQARLVVLPMGRDEQLRLDDQESTAAVVMVEAQQPALAPKFLYEKFGLTAAEARIALALAAGKTPKQLSESLHVSPQTVKTHIRHIFQKTGTERQVDLVRLVYRIPALI